MTPADPPPRGALPDIRPTDSPPEAEWTDLVERAFRGTFFHHLHWSRLYAAHHGGEAVFLTAVADGRLVGGLPMVRFRRGPFHYVESLPMGTYGGPLVDPTCTEGAAVEEALLERLLDLTGDRRCLRLQCVIRGGDAVDRYAAFEPTAIHLLPLDGGFEHFWLRVFPRNRRNECNRAAKRGVRAEWGADPRHISAFYELHVEAHRRWGLAPHPEAFFHDICAADPERASFVSILHEDTFLGAHLTFISGRELVAWHGVTRREGSKTYFPSSVIVKAEAEEGCRRGLEAVNLGGSGGHEGVEGFKKMVGGISGTAAAYEVESSLMGLMRRLRRR